MSTERGKIFDRSECFGARRRVNEFFVELNAVAKAIKFGERPGEEMLRPEFNLPEDIAAHLSVCELCDNHWNTRIDQFTRKYADLSIQPRWTWPQKKEE